MAYRDLHIRVTDNQYAFLCELAHNLNLPLAEVIRRALFTSDMDRIVQNYHKRMEMDELALRCRLDDGTREYLEKYISDLNTNTAQLRKIGSNVSAFVRDLRAGDLPAVSSSIPQIWTKMDAISRRCRSVLDRQGLLAQHLVECMAGAKLEIYQQDQKGA